MSRSLALNRVDSVTPVRVNARLDLVSRNLVAIQALADVQPDTSPVDLDELRAVIGALAKEAREALPDDDDTPNRQTVGDCHDCGEPAAVRLIAERLDGDGYQDQMTLCDACLERRNNQGVGR